MWVLAVVACGPLVLTRQRAPLLRCHRRNAWAVFWYVPHCRAKHTFRACLCGNLCTAPRCGDRAPLTRNCAGCRYLTVTFGACTYFAFAWRGTAYVPSLAPFSSVHHEQYEFGVVAVALSITFVLYLTFLYVPGHAAVASSACAVAVAM